MIDPNVKFGISGQSGCYFLSHIPIQRIKHYIERLRHYDVEYKIKYKAISGNSIILYDANNDEVRKSVPFVVAIVFSYIEHSFYVKLRTLYGLVDKRKYNLPIDREILFLDKSFVCFTEKSTQNNIDQLEAYLRQYFQDNFFKDM